MRIRLSRLAGGLTAIAVYCAAGLCLTKVVAQTATTSAADIRVPPAGWRDWRLISVAHEAGQLNDLRAILGNDVAVEAFRAGRLPFPDGAIIARVAWAYTKSTENNEVFGREQSFVAGAPTDWYLQFMIKDARKYAATGGWGYAQFDVHGKTAEPAKLATCYPCHVPVKDRDFVFTHYAP